MRGVLRRVSSSASRASPFTTHLSEQLHNHHTTKSLTPNPPSKSKLFKSPEKNPATTISFPGNNSSLKSPIQYSRVNAIDHKYISQILSRKDWVLLLNHELKSQRITLNAQFIASVFQNQDNPLHALLFYVWVSNCNHVFTKNQSICGVLGHVLHRKGPVLLSPDLIQNIRSSGFRVTEDLLCILLRSWGKLGLAKYCCEVFEQISYLGLGPSTRLYNAVIDSLVLSNSLDLAYLKFQQMQVDNCRPDRFTYNILIHGVCKAGVVDEAIRLMKQMQGFGYSPNVFTYTILIDGFCNSNRVDEAFRVLDTMKVSKVKPNDATFRSLVNGVFRSVSSHKAFEMLSAFVEQEPVLPRAACDTILYCLSNRSLHKEAAAFMRKMLDKGYIPDSSIFNITMTCLIKGLDHEDICELFDRLIGQGMKVGFNTYLALIEAFYGTEKVEKGNHYLNKMFEDGLVMDVFSYNMVIDCFVKANMINRASATFKEMLERSVVPNLVTFNTLINGHCKAGNVAEALEILKMLLAHGFKPDIFTFSSIIDGLCKVHRIDDAFDCFEEMFDWGVKPNAITYNILIRTLCVKGDFPRGMKLLKNMRSEGIMPDVFSLNALIQSFCKVNKIERAQKILVTMLALNLSPDNVTYSAFITALCRAGRFDEAKELFLTMEVNGCSPDYTTCKIFIDALVHSARFEDARAVLCICRERGMELKSSLISE